LGLDENFPYVLWGVLGDVSMEDDTCCMKWFIPISLGANVFQDGRPFSIMIVTLNAERSVASTNTSDGCGNRNGKPQVLL
jgi:hypothetical protein